MAITPTNASAINRLTSGTTNTVTLPAAPAVGSKIVYALTVDKTAGTFTAPAGFTARASVSAASVSLFSAEKTADGTETGAIGATWTTSRSSKACIFELTSTGTIAFDVAAQNNTETAGQSLSTGSASSGANAALAVLLFANDSAKSIPTNPDPTGSWSNGSTWLQNWTASASGDTAFVLGTWTGFTPGSALSSTYSHDGNSDQMAAAILVFSETGSSTTFTHSGSGGITSGGAATASYTAGGTGEPQSAILQQTLFQLNGSQTLTGFTVPVGTTAIAFVFSHEQTNAAYIPTALTLGGVTAARYGGNQHSVGLPFGEGWVITSGFGSLPANPTLAITAAAGGNAFFTGTIFCLSGVELNTELWDYAQDSNTHANLMTWDAVTPVGALILGVMTSTLAGSGFTTNAPLTEVTGSDRDFNSATSRAVAFHHRATDEITTVSGRSSNTGSTNYQVLYAMVIPSLYSSAPGTFTHTATGGISSAGAAIAKRTFTAIGSGGFSSGGITSTITVSYTVSEGGITAGGTAAASVVAQGVTVYSFVATGGITAAGTGITGRVRGFVASGGVTSAGTATLKRCFTAVTSGGFNVYGFATVTSTVIPVYTTSTVLMRRRRRHA